MNQIIPITNSLAVLHLLVYTQPDVFNEYVCRTENASRSGCSGPVPELLLYMYWRVIPITHHSPVSRGRCLDHCLDRDWRTSEGRK